VIMESACIVWFGVAVLAGFRVMWHAVVTTHPVSPHNVLRGDIRCFEALCAVNRELCCYSFGGIGTGDVPSSVLSIMIIHC
jgi:hypothetical protein